MKPRNLIFIITFAAIVPFAAHATDVNLNTGVDSNADTAIINVQPLAVQADANGEVEVTSTSTSPSQALDAARQAADSIVSNPGILPDSKWYFLKGWWEKIQLTFTFDSAHKAELENTFALKRVAEAQKLVEKGKADLAQQHLSQFKSALDGMNARVEKAKAQGKNADDLVQKLEITQQRQQDVLNNIYAKVPEQAKAGILNAMEQSSKGLENAVQQMQGTQEAQQLRARLQTHLDQGGDLELQIKEKLNERGVFQDIKSKIKAVEDNPSGISPVNQNTNQAGENTNGTNGE